MSNEELRKRLDFCLNVGECSGCKYRTETSCIMTCKALIKECLNENYVEVVRCKDCVCFNDNMPTRPFCDHFGAAIDLMHFCSYGDRKES